MPLNETAHEMGLPMRDRAIRQAERGDHLGCWVTEDDYYTVRDIDKPPDEPGWTRIWPPETEKT